MSGRIGHSVTFEWKFSGGVDTVTWGLANEVNLKIDKQFVSLDGRGVDVLLPRLVPEAYRGRVNGTRTGDSSSGQANFTLYDVTKDDERLYGCWLKPNNPNFREITDFVQLVVVGMYLFYRTLDSSARTRYSKFSHIFISRWAMIIRVSVVLNRTAFDSD